jgi:CxxC motif-containing protein (DUF1111 family)
MTRVPPVLAVGALLLAAACDQSSPSQLPVDAGDRVPVSAVLDPEDPPTGVRPPLGGPIPGLSERELAAFRRGKRVFERRFKPSQGLGPRYNATSCSSCHSTPVTGGSAELYRNFYVAMRGPQTNQRPLAGLPSLVVPAYGTDPDFNLEKARATITGGQLALEVAQRGSIPIFGTGLFEFVRDSTIISNTDIDDDDKNGISGRYNIGDNGLGRFGTKAQVNNIEVFTRAPLNTQMGITTDPFLGAGGGVSMACTAVAQAGGMANDPTRDLDNVPDPELSRQDLGDLIAFTRFLAPPGKKMPFTSAAMEGEMLFDSIGCAKCHIPSLPSTRGPVEAYTDLLLHAMGSGLADNLNLGTPQLSQKNMSSLTGNEWRTAPLWGVSLHAPFMHDGRAETLRDAIELHAGESRFSRDRFRALSPEEQDKIIEFLEHL